MGYNRCLTVVCAVVMALFMQTVSQSIDEIKFIGIDGPQQFWNFEETPICSSYQSLCRISMNITRLKQGRIRAQTYPHERQHCACPGNITCPTDKEDGGKRSIRRVFRSRGTVIRARMDYCNLTLPERRCYKNEPAFTLQGNGPFMLEMYGDYNCYCKRELFAHRSWTDGKFNFMEYSCGKPRCHRLERRSDNTDAICMTVTNTNSSKTTLAPFLLHEYKCRCRYYEECVVVGELPVKENQTAHAYCQDIFSRRKQVLH